MEKSLHTTHGMVHYGLERKKVRNLNLRIRRDGSIYVSAPLRMPSKDIELFLQSKSRWIFEKQQEMQNLKPILPCIYTKEQCLVRFAEISDQIFPLFAQHLTEKPLLSVRDMKSRWGSCHPRKRKITLSTRLAEQPYPLIEYVILHEYVHFLHPNHGPGFHAEMAKLMPDYRERRKQLRG